MVDKRSITCIYMFWAVHAPGKNNPRRK